MKQNTTSSTAETTDKHEAPFVVLTPRFKRIWYTKKYRLSQRTVTFVWNQREHIVKYAFITAIDHQNKPITFIITPYKTYSVQESTLHKKVKDISQYLDLNTKIKAISRNGTKHLDNFKISLTFLCSVDTWISLRSHSGAVDPKRAPTVNLAGRLHNSYSLIYTVKATPLAKLVFTHR